MGGDIYYMKKLSHFVTSEMSENGVCCLQFKLQLRTHSVCHIPVKLEQLCYYF